MPKFTKVYEMPAKPQKNHEAKVLVFIDGQKCTPIRARTWVGMRLKVGDAKVTAI